MSRRILVVEDDPDTAEYVLKGLREDGYTVEHVADGRDGLYLATTSRFDAIVMDRMVPGMDGLSVIKALRAAGIDTPIMILSALAQMDERVKGLRSGGDDYPAKPFGYSELSARLENLMRRGGSKVPESKLVCGDLQMDLLARKVARAGAHDALACPRRCPADWRESGHRAECAAAASVPRRHPRNIRSRCSAGRAGLHRGGPRAERHSAAVSNRIQPRTPIWGSLLGSDGPASDFHCRP